MKHKRLWEQNTPPTGWIFFFVEWEGEGERGRRLVVEKLNITLSICSEGNVRIHQGRLFGLWHTYECLPNKSRERMKDTLQEITGSVSKGLVARMRQENEHLTKVNDATHKLERRMNDAFVDRPIIPPSALFDERGRA